MVWIFSSGKESSAYDLGWLKDQLEQAGFRDVEFYGERTFLPPQPEEERVFITARKEETT